MRNTIITESRKFLREKYGVSSVVLLHAEKDLKFREIGEILHISTDTAKSRARSERLALEKYLKSIHLEAA